jgi:hypothetical protein
MKGNGKRSVYLLSSFLLIAFCSISFAQDEDVQKNDLLLEEVHKWENIIKAAIEDIQKYEDEIRNCDNMISEAEKKVWLAGRRGTVQMNETASEALSKAQAERIKYIDLKNSAESNKNKALIALTEAKKRYMEEVNSKPMLYEEPETLEAARIIKSMNALAKQLGWSADEQARLDKALNGMGFDGPPEVDVDHIKNIWSRMSARDEDTDLMKEASQGRGIGSLGEVNRPQTANDCAIFALATATGLSYDVVANRAKELISNGNWRFSFERENPQKVIEAGLTGGEVAMLAEAFGRAEVVPSSAFAKTLKEGHPVLVNVVPESGKNQFGHEVVLIKTFQHGGEDWFEMVDSNRPRQRLFLSAKELFTLLQEKGVAFLQEPKSTSKPLRQ